MTDVVLVSMPYAGVERPSIALGLLKAALAKSEIGVEVVYANLFFAETLGLSLYQAISGTPTDLLLGEWCFSGDLFPDFDPDEEAYLELTTGRGLGGFSGRTEEIKNIFHKVRAKVPAFLDRLAGSIVSRRPRIVGCSSMFQQHCASLSLLRRVRERSPRTVTLLGGANCEGPMGAATVRSFPWVDLAVSGEADGLIVDLCRLLLERGRHVAPEELPPSVLLPSSNGGGSTEAPRGASRDLDALPTPDFDDYFLALRGSKLRGRIRPGLPVESSRGCWWGEKSHCTFCGLNGIGMGYRSKSAPRVIEELAELHTRYGIRHFEFVDNILDMAHVKTVLPALAEAEEEYRIFYETKSNLRREQLRSLAAAGVRWIQPGIESLHDAVLSLIAKGNSAMMNLELLKHAGENGIRLSWNLLCDFPGEADAWYFEMARWFPLISHLQPPAGVIRLRYDRFSPYHARPEDYGLQLAPVRTYPYIYPLPPESLADLAYFFEAAGTTEEIHRGLKHRGGHRRVEAVVDRWNQAWVGPPPTLRLVDEGDRLRIYDTRPCAQSPRWTVKGLAMAVYRACDCAQNPAALLRKLGSPFDASADRESIERAVNVLCGHGLMLRLDGKLLSLALADDAPELPRNEDFPGGWAFGEEGPPKEE